MGSHYISVRSSEHGIMGNINMIRRNTQPEKKQELEKLKKFSSFLYNDSPVVTENPASASGRFSSQDEGTEIKVSRHLLTQLENCDSTISDNFTSEVDFLRGIKA